MTTALRRVTLIERPQPVKSVRVYVQKNEKQGQWNAVATLPERVRLAGALGPGRVATWRLPMEAKEQKEAPREGEVRLTEAELRFLDFLIDLVVRSCN